LQWNPAIWVRDARQYVLDVRSEFRKLTWPTQREYVGGTIGVIAIVAILSVALGGLDVALGAAMRAILP
jgi:preprotein translocase SecE subunit